MAGSDPAVEAGVAAGQQAAALGRSQIQAATTVGQGYDAGQLGVYAPFGGAMGTPQANQLLVASQARFSRFVMPRTMPISKLNFYVAAAATNDDPVDVGIYAASGPPLARLASSGSVGGKLTAVGVQSVNLPAPIFLIAGQIYYAAFVCGPVGGTAAQVTMGSMITGALAGLPGAVVPTLEQGFTNGAFPLPASLSIGGQLNAMPLLFLAQ
jgi:hypothetical protein